MSKDYYTVYFYCDALVDEDDFYQDTCEHEWTEIVFKEDVAEDGSVESKCPMCGSIVFGQIDEFEY